MSAARKAEPLRIQALIIRTGVALPPPSGPARAHHCLTEGEASLRRARVSRSRGLRILAAAAPELLAGTPTPIGLERPLPAWLLAGADRRRIVQWLEISAALHAARAQWAAQPLDRALTEAEAELRSALKSASGALHWFSDLVIDIDEYATSEHAARQVRELRDDAHSLLHETGALTGGLFGCWLEHEDGIWFEKCETSLAHVPLGNSAGFTAVARCSICHEDASECEHLNGESYWIEVLRGNDGKCSVCGDGCDHEHGRTYRFEASAYVSEGTLREVSFVSRPRDPLARITAREIPLEELVEALGRTPSPDEKVRHHACMTYCEGMRSRPTDP